MEMDPREFADWIIARVAGAAGPAGVVLGDVELATGTEFGVAVDVHLGNGQTFRCHVEDLTEDEDEDDEVDDEDDEDEEGGCAVCGAEVAADKLTPCDACGDACCAECLDEDGLCSSCLGEEE